MTIVLRAACGDDVGLIVTLIRELAVYEQLAHEAVATDDDLRTTLFGARPAAEVLIAELAGVPVGFALFFTSYSTFLGKPGLYLEDLFVRPAARRHGVGRAVMIELARIAVARNYGRFEWSVLDWNEPALAFYRALGAVPMTGWTVQRVTGVALATLARSV